MYLFLGFVFILTLKNVVSLDSGCDANQLPCDDGKQCIDRYQWCDRKKQCEDGSDESYCKTSWWPAADVNNCKHSHFLCPGGQCVPLAAKCDGYSDCEDDEDDCDDPSISSFESSEVETTAKTILKTEQDSDEDIISQMSPIQKSSSTHVPVLAPLTAPFPTRSSFTRSVMPNPTLRSVRRLYPAHDKLSSTYDRQPPTNRIDGNSPHLTDPDWTETISLKPYKRKIDVVKKFHFSKDYACISRGVNAAHLRRAENWLLMKRGSSGDWRRDTARAITALALINNSFESGKSENELMKLRFLVQLSADLLRNDTNSFNVNRMAMALSALMAVCENPRDFHGMDLTEMLRAKMRDQKRQQQRQRINPFVYLSLCLSGSSFIPQDIQDLEEYLNPSPRSPEKMNKDMLSLSIQALACYLQTNDSHDQQAYQTTLRNAVFYLLQHMHADGSFGNVYSTALAAQALISVNYSSIWSSQKTMDFLKQHQKGDGSFGNLLATYYVLPVLSGRSLLHLRNIQCNSPVVPRDLTPPEFAGPKQDIHYSIYFGYPLDSSYSMTLAVPPGVNFLEVMRMAEHRDSNFRFSYEEDNQKIYVFSVSGLPNDAEQGISWHLYVKPTSNPHQQQLDTWQYVGGDVREFFPEPDQHIIFWYHSIGLRNYD